MDSAIDTLIQQSRLLLGQLRAPYLRAFYHTVDWDWRLIGILGARGVGKTTLLLQHASRFPVEQAIYLSLDDLYFAEYSLKSTVVDLAERGYRYFFLDEVHKYPTWSREIKNLYDFNPEIKVVFTGSSLIEWRKQQVDLSRRALIYSMPGLSFREFLGLNGTLEVSAFPLEELLARQQKIASDLTGRFKPLQHMEAYLRFGVYPFYLEGEARYPIRLKQVVQLVIEGDLGIGVEGTVEQPHKLKQLLQVVADSVPFTPNISKLARKIGLDRNTLLRYLYVLDQARLVHLLYPAGKGISRLQKPSKLYLENTNLAYALTTGQPDRGNLRETFFLQQVSPGHRVNQHPATDFLIDERWAVEVGGAGKSARQIAGIADSFRVLDDLTIGSKGRVPLWLFGLVY